VFWEILRILAGVYLFIFVFIIKVYCRGQLLSARGHNYISMCYIGSRAKAILCKELY
jgi:hypothetical protein